MKILIVNLVRFLFFFSHFLSVYCEKYRYDNHYVYSIKAKKDQIDILNKLENSNGILYMNDLSIHQPFEIVVEPEEVANVTRLFREFDIDYKIQTKNLQR